MLIRRTKGWEIPESKATSGEPLSQSTRDGAGDGARCGLARPARQLMAQDKAPIRRPDCIPPKRNDKYGVPTPMTAEKLATTYNNFYEFGTDKSIWRDAQKLEVRPWTIKVGGMVEKPFEIGIDDLLAKVQLEERVYRHRCVETWSMIVPWSGFPVARW